jgi:Ran GTPase-activating protein (RanGAP) involved in mRNA processing and transport
MCTFFTQQLVQLDLSGNAIGDEGANYLANSLENRQVSHILYLLLLLAYILFDTGTHG